MGYRHMMNNKRGNTMNSIAGDARLSGAREQNCCNARPLSSSSTRTNGSTDTSGVAEVTGSLLLVNSDPTVATRVQAMPKMQGSGAVRDLSEAMSLRTSAAALQIKVNVITIKFDSFCGRESWAGI